MSEAKQFLIGTLVVVVIMLLMVDNRGKNDFSNNLSDVPYQNNESTEDGETFHCRAYYIDAESAKKMAKEKGIDVDKISKESFDKFISDINSEPLCSDFCKEQAKLSKQEFLEFDEPYSLIAQCKIWGVDIKTLD